MKHILREDKKAKTKAFFFRSDASVFNKKFINTIDNVIKNNKAIKKKSIIAKNFYLKKYSMKKITNNFLKNYL